MRSVKSSKRLAYTPGGLAQARRLGIGAQLYAERRGRLQNICWRVKTTRTDRRSCSAIDRHRSTGIADGWLNEGVSRRSSHRPDLVGGTEDLCRASLPMSLVLSCTRLPSGWTFNVDVVPGIVLLTYASSRVIP